MNERIRLLAEQAGLKFPSETAMSPAELKFAELIVAECGLWFNNRLVVNPDYGIEHRIERNRAVVGVMKEFNRHFGIAE
jgi:hypothetical protein